VKAGPTKEKMTHKIFIAQIIKKMPSQKAMAFF
jgi:hypothetical protein